MSARPLRIGLPDLISPSYFPIIAAVELGYLRDEGVDAEIELVFPVPAAAKALKERDLDLLAGAAHAPLYAFPEWDGVKLIAALSQHMYWFLVVRADLGIARGDLSAVSGIRIGAAPGVADGLVHLLRVLGIDPETERIAPVPGAGAGVSFGVTAASALQAGLIDGFWANGMAAEIAVRAGTGTIVLDARRDHHPGRGFTFPALAATERDIDERSEVLAGAVRGLIRAQEALRADPEVAEEAAARLFPAYERSLMATLIGRDAPFYTAAITETAVMDLNNFAAGIGLYPAVRPAYEKVVSVELAGLWPTNRRS